MYDGLSPEKAEFSGISKLVPVGRNAIYQFDVSDLKDYWGEPFVFSLITPLLKFQLQTTEDLAVLFALNNNVCSFQNGEYLVRNIESFVRDMSRQGIK